MHGAVAGSNEQAARFFGQETIMIERDKSLRTPREPDDAQPGARNARPDEEHLLKPDEEERPKARGAATEAAAQGSEDAE
jgi:hypothetical protein